MFIEKKTHAHVIERTEQKTRPTDDESEQEDFLDAIVFVWSLLHVIMILEGIPSHKSL